MPAIEPLATPNSSFAVPSQQILWSHFDHQQPSAFLSIKSQLPVKITTVKRFAQESPAVIKNLSRAFSGVLGSHLT